MVGRVWPRHRQRGRRLNSVVSRYSMAPRESTGQLEGYSGNASELIARYEAIGFTEKHEALLPLIPPRCSRALDIGAGAGGDAAWLAAQGHDVVAVEPTPEFRTYARQRYCSPRIEWVDDRLPYLQRVASRLQTFDVILISAVWMHLEQRDRARAMPIVASLLSPRGLLYISLRHGPVPKGRTMFEVSAAETVADAQRSGLEPVLHRDAISAQRANRKAGVTWSQLAFVKRINIAPAHGISGEAAWPFS